MPSESTFDYLRETKSYVARYGRPIAFYSDKFSVFRVNRKDAAGGDGMTQFGRALHAHVLFTALVAGWAIGLLVWLCEIPGDTGPPYDA